MTIEETHPAVACMVKLYCHANAFDLEGLRKQVHMGKWLSLNPTFKVDFCEVIQRRLLSPDEYCRLTAFDFETAEEVAKQLEAVFNYIYHQGPHP